jgi:hypothetical protein
VTKSNVYGIHLWGCSVSKRLFTVTRYHLSCSGHPTYRILRVPLLSYHSNRVQVAETSLYEPLYLSSNVHISSNQLHNSFCTFPILPKILPTKKNEATQFHYNYQTQHAPQTPKIFQCISEYTFCRTQLVAMHNTVMTRKTNGVPLSETHITRIPSSSADRLTVWQFKYWGKGASEDIMTTYMIMYCLSKIQSISIINLLLSKNAQIILIYIFHHIWIHEAFVTKRL